MMLYLCMVVSAALTVLRAGPHCYSSPILQPIACTWLCPAGFWAGISWKSTWGLSRLHSSLPTQTQVKSRISTSSLILPMRERNLNNSISLRIKNKMCCLSPSQRRCSHSWWRNGFVHPVTAFACTELVISVEIGYFTAMDYSLTLYNYLETSHLSLVSLRLF